MSQYAYGPYADSGQSNSLFSNLTTGQKVLTMLGGGLLAHRGAIGLKRLAIMSKMKKHALKGLRPTDQKKILKNMKLDPSYERWAQKKVSK